MHELNVNTTHLLCRHFLQRLFGRMGAKHTDDVPDGIRRLAERGKQSLMPAKSKERYEQTLAQFDTWKEKHAVAAEG